MPKQPLTFRKVLMMGITIGIVTMIVTFFMQYRQNRHVQTSREGGLPVLPDVGDVHRYATDPEGDHYYATIRSNSTSPSKVEVWSRFIYSDQGKRIYLQKRKQNGMFVDGFDGLSQRTTRVELECAPNKREYAVIEVFEVARDGKTLDYARTGSTKNWEAIPEGTFLDKLAAVACPHTSQ
jgi:hypothetical protein